MAGLPSRAPQAVKEMVLLPLLYPEVFERFRFTPPRGVLFHGPPGNAFAVPCPVLAVCAHGVRPTLSRDG